MSDIKVEGFQSSDVLEGIAGAFAAASDDEKKAQIKKVNAIFELRIKNKEGKEGVWTIDLKKTGSLYTGPAKPKPDVTILLDDATFVDLATGKLDGQKAFMTGKLKAKGNIMLATKLDGVLKQNKAKAKL